MAMRFFKQSLFENFACPAFHFTKTRRQYNGGFHLMFTAGADDAWHGGCGACNDRQINPFMDAIQRVKARFISDLLIFWVNGINGSAETSCH